MPNWAVKRRTRQEEISLTICPSKMCFITSHGNSAPESGFSINKSILEVHGRSLGEDTLEASRVVKDAIVNSGSVLNIPITHTLIISVKNSYQKYQADLEAKRRKWIVKEAQQLKRKLAEDKEV